MASSCSTKGSRKVHAPRAAVEQEGPLVSPERQAAQPVEQQDSGEQHRRSRQQRSRPGGKLASAFAAPRGGAGGGGGGCAHGEYFREGSTCARCSSQARGRPEGLQPVDRGGAEAHRGGIGEIASARRYLLDVEAEVGCLHEQLGIKAEVERVSQEGHGQEQLATVGAVARVQVGQLGLEHAVLDTGQGAVGESLVEGHAGLLRRPGDHHARAEYQVGLSRTDRLDQLGDQLRLVLAVGVQHDDDLRVALERLEIAGLLVAAVTDVVRMPDDAHSEPARDLERLIGGAVVDEDDLVHDVAWDRAHGELERLRRVQRGHHHDRLGAAGWPRHPGPRPGALSQARRAST